MFGYQLYTPLPAESDNRDGSVTSGSDESKDRFAIGIQEFNPGCREESFLTIEEL